MPIFHFIKSKTSTAPDSGYASRITQSKWAEVEGLVRHLHKQGRTKEEIRAYLLKEKNVHPSIGQLQARMQRWGLGRYKTARSKDLSSLTKSEQIIHHHNPVVSTTSSVHYEGRKAKHYMINDQRLSPAELKDLFQIADLLASGGLHSEAHKVYIATLYYASSIAHGTDPMTTCLVEGIFGYLMTLGPSDHLAHATSSIITYLHEQMMPSPHQSLFLRFIHLHRFRYLRQQIPLRHFTDVDGQVQLEVSQDFWRVVLGHHSSIKTKLPTWESLPPCYIPIKFNVADNLISILSQQYHLLNPITDSATSILSIDPDPTSLLSKCIDNIDGDAGLMRRLDSILHRAEVDRKLRLFQHTYLKCLEIDSADSSPAAWATTKIELAGSEFYVMSGIQAISIIARMMAEEAENIGNIETAMARWDILCCSAYQGQVQERFLAGQESLLTCSDHDQLGMTSTQAEADFQVLVQNLFSQKAFNIYNEAIRLSIDQLNLPITDLAPCCDDDMSASPLNSLNNDFDPPLTKALNISNDSFDFIRSTSPNRIRSQVFFEMSSPLPVSSTSPKPAPLRGEHEGSLLAIPSNLPYAQVDDRNHSISSGFSIPSSLNIADHELTLPKGDGDISHYMGRSESRDRLEQDSFIPRAALRRPTVNIHNQYGTPYTRDSYGSTLTFHQRTSVAQPASYARKFRSSRGTMSQQINRSDENRHSPSVPPVQIFWKISGVYNSPLYSPNVSESSFAIGIADSPVASGSHNAPQAPYHDGDSVPDVNKSSLSLGSDYGLQGLFIEEQNNPQHPTANDEIYIANGKVGQDLRTTHHDKPQRKPTSSTSMDDVAHKNESRPRSGSDPELPKEDLHSGSPKVQQQALKIEGGGGEAGTKASRRSIHEVYTAIIKYVFNGRGKERKTKNGLDKSLFSK